MLTGPIGSQISYVGSPLLIPSWAVLNVFISLVFWIWIVAVALYYTNVWNTAYLPFQSSQGTSHPFKLLGRPHLTCANSIRQYWKYLQSQTDCQCSFRLQARCQEVSCLFTGIFASSIISKTCHPANLRGKLGLYAGYLRVEHVWAIVCNPERSSCLGRP